MDDERRVLLRATLASPLVLLAATGIASTSISADSIQTLKAYLDILIPADESPAASAVGVHEALLASMKADGRYHYLVTEGISWLARQADAVAQRPFAELPLSAQEDVVTRLAGQRVSTLLKLFFDRTRADAMRAYYAQPLAWPTLGINATPQPVGHPNYTQPPSRTRDTSV